VGRTAEVHAWRDGEIVKLLRAEFPDTLGELEARAAARVVAAGLAAPRFVGTTRVDGRFGLVYERVDGPSMLAVIAERPERALDLAARLAELHAAMHEQPGGELPAAAEGLGQAIRAAKVGDAIREAALARVAGLPVGTALVHGDLHPGNVLMTARGPMAIDWLTAGAGSAHADVARTLFLLTGTVLGDDIPREHHALVEELRHRFADAYLERYRQLRPLDDVELRAWRLPVLVARMAEEVAGEEASLREQIAAER
jgi:aminoglycoside phosphotransferase (APT) family kinase protein